MTAEGPDGGPTTSPRVRTELDLESGDTLAESAVSGLSDWPGRTTTTVDKASAQMRTLAAGTGLLWLSLFSFVLGQGSVGLGGAIAISVLGTIVILAVVTAMARWARRRDRSHHE